MLNSNAEPEIIEELLFLGANGAALRLESGTPLDNSIARSILLLHMDLCEHLQENAWRNFVVTQIEQLRAVI